MTVMMCTLQPKKPDLGKKTLPEKNSDLKVPFHLSSVHDGYTKGECDMYYKIEGVFFAPPDKSCLQKCTRQDIL